ncbi:AbfB domain-containing protein [Micromonospora sp. LOL_015]|uniref:AbfB domain-containing protein n=1 Tax=Micromonospora sp. LOL_015 TaxID=3345416 RepID=UPI003A8866FC
MTAKGVGHEAIAIHGQLAGGDNRRPGDCGHHHRRGRRRPAAVAAAVPARRPVHQPDRRTAGRPARAPAHRRLLLLRRHRPRVRPDRHAPGHHPAGPAAHDQPDRYLRQWEYRVRLEANVANLADSQFRVVPGLANSAGISLESTNFPGYYLRHRNHQIWVEANDGSNLFRQDATFMARAGLADAGKLSLESVNFPGQYVRHRDGLLYLEAVPDAAGRASATFTVS